MKPSEAVLSVVLALGLLAAPLPSDGQQSPKLSRIGYLFPDTPPAPSDRSPQHCPIKGGPNWQAWLAGLRARGYILGQNLVIECRWTEARDERAPALAAELVELAAQSRLPAMYPGRNHVEAGGLLAYEVNRPDTLRRLGFYVDKILNGAKPGDLPVEQPTKFKLLVNLKTAKALGLTIPRSVLLRADEVIQ